MGQHHFVVLINQQADVRIAHFYGREMLTLRTCHLADDDNRLDVLRWWQQFPQARVLFLSNLVDEQYHVETLPHVVGAAGRQLLLRRLSAWPFAKGLYTALRLNSVQTLRKEDRFLFAAIFCPPLSAWLKELQAQSLRIEGVYTQALTLACWIPEKPKGVVHRLCIQCWQQQVRISYLQQHRLFFSRLLSMPLDGFADQRAWFDRIAQEARQIYLTMTQQHWIQESEVLEIVWLGEVLDDADGLKKYFPSNGLWVCIPTLEISRQIDRKPVPEGLNVMDWAAMQSILQTNILPNLAPEQTLRFSRILRFKRKMHWLGLAMSGLMLLAGWLGVEAMQHDRLQTERLQHRLKALNAVQPISDLSQAQWPSLRALMLAVKKLEASVRLPDEALLLLNHASADFSGWQLTALQWEAHRAVESLDDTIGEQQTLLATWRSIVSNHQAEREWQQLLNSLRSRPEIEKVEIVRPSGDDATVRQGDTRQIVLDKPVLKIYLKRTGQAAL